VIGRPEMASKPPEGRAGPAVLLAGATGLVGRHARRLLAESGRASRLVLLGRRAIPVDPGRGEVLAVIDFHAFPDTLPGAPLDAVLWTLGTTLRKAGSRDAFRRVDHDYALALAGRARAAGVPHFGLVSALGADPGSRVFYNRVKGELEEGVRDLGFPSLRILRPSILLGARGERRPAEAVGKLLSLLVPGNLRGVRAEDVARLLVDGALRPPPGAEVIESGMIRRRARGIEPARIPTEEAT
jgi:uncharacterized protein YbjT (DUF2867 family)